MVHFRQLVGAVSMKNEASTPPLKQSYNFVFRIWQNPGLEIPDVNQGARLQREKLEMFL